MRNKVAMLACALLSGPLAAGDFEDAFVAASIGDFAKAAQLWGPLAVQGNRNAQYMVGLMHGTGAGVAQNEIEAAKWMRLAAESGSAGAQGELGSMYESGRGVPQNFAEALKWYRLSAEQGNPYAQTSLAGLYGNGKGVAQNYIVAHTYANLASNSQGYDGSQRSWARGVRDDFARVMTPDQVAEAQRRAANWVAQGGDKDGYGPWVGSRLPEELSLVLARTAARDIRYPSQAQLMRWQGTTEVLMRIGADAKLKDASIAKSSGYDILDAEALDKVRRLKEIDHVPNAFVGREFSVTVPIAFRLQ